MPSKLPPPNQPLPSVPPSYRDRVEKKSTLIDPPSSQQPDRDALEKAYSPNSPTKFAAPRKMFGENGEDKQALMKQSNMQEQPGRRKDSVHRMQQPRSPSSPTSEISAAHPGHQQQRSDRNTNQGRLDHGRGEAINSSTHFADVEAATAKSDKPQSIAFAGTGTLVHTTQQGEEQDNWEDPPYSNSDIELEMEGMHTNAHRLVLTRGKSNRGVSMDMSDGSEGAFARQRDDSKLPRTPSRTDNLAPVLEHSVGKLSKGNTSELDFAHRNKPESRMGNSTRDRDDNDSLSETTINTYRKVGLRSTTLSDWAPSAEPTRSVWGGIPNLPDWNTMRADDPTSRPIVHVQRDLDWSMRRLINENIFEQLLNDPLGRHRFRDFLMQKLGTENKLDMFFDLGQYIKQNKSIRQMSEALFDLYLAQDSDGHVALPSELGLHLYDVVRKQHEVKASLGTVQQHLLRTLYREEFQIFIKAQLVEHNRVKLGTFVDDETADSGLGDCYCLTNPRLRENPIVLVSPGFETLTGYPGPQVIGRNCRFLQGPGTAPDSVQRIRESLNAGRSCTELLLNYRRDGTPFFCLLTSIPLRDTTGTLVYFIGGQTNVSGQLASAKGLQFLLGGSEGTEDVVASSGKSMMVDGREVSPLLARYCKAGGLARASESSFSDPSASRVFSETRSISSPRGEGLAAGAYIPKKNGRARQTLPSQHTNMLTPEPQQTKGKIKTSFFGRRKRNTLSNQAEKTSQRLIGAEATARQDPHSLEEHMTYFASLYSKTIIFKRVNREIIFVTRGAISSFGLPTESKRDIFASPLLHVDLLSIVRGADKDETKLVRRSIQKAVQEGKSISVKTGIVQPITKSRFLATQSHRWVTGLDGPKYTTIHISPLQDRDASSFAFVAVFG